MGSNQRLGTETKKSIYGQFCPLAMSAEFLCSRWTMLVLRELLLGAYAFNDIARGVPRMSRSLLSRRLKELENIGVIERSPVGTEDQAGYTLTEAGRNLGPVVFSMADWGQEWLNIQASLQDLDADLLMWSIRRNINHLTELPSPFIVQFVLTDVPENKRNRWLISDVNDVDLCYIDHDYDVDMQIDVSTEILTSVWMGWQSFDETINAGKIVLRGPKKYTDFAAKWLGQSNLARIKKQPVENRVS